jgi:hypothetical protein
MNLWAEECASLQDFFRQVESVYEFLVAVQYGPYALEISREQV